MFNKMVIPTGGGGKKLSLLITIDNSQITKTSTTLKADLSSLTNASSLVLFEDFVPVLKGATLGGGGGSVHIYGTWTYDSSTHILTLTLSGDTGYIYFNGTGPAFGIDIYGL